MKNDSDESPAQVHSTEDSSAKSNIHFQKEINPIIEEAINLQFKKVKNALTHSNSHDPLMKINRNKRNNAKGIGADMESNSKETRTEETKLRNKVAKLTEKIAKIDYTSPLTAIKALREEIDSLRQEAAKLGITIAVDNLQTSLESKESSAQSYQNTLFIQQRIESDKKEPSLEEVGEQLKGKLAAFKEVTGSHIKGQEEEVKNLKNIDKDLVAEKVISQQDLDAQILNDEQLQLEKERYAAMCKYQKDVTDHHNNLTNAVNEHRERLGVEKRAPAREEINNSLRNLNQQLDEHTGLKTVVDKQMEAVHKLHKEKLEVLDSIEQHANALSSEREDKEPLKKFTARKRKEHAAIIEAGNLHKNPMQEIVDGANVQIPKGSIKNVKDSTKIDSPPTTPSQGTKGKGNGADGSGTHGR